MHSHRPAAQPDLSESLPDAQTIDLISRYIDRKTTPQENLRAEQLMQSDPRIHDLVIGARLLEQPATAQEQQLLDAAHAAKPANNLAAELLKQASIIIPGAVPQSLSLPTHHPVAPQPWPNRAIPLLVAVIALLTVLALLLW